jgi:hypothetical protein
MEHCPQKSWISDWWDAVFYIDNVTSHHVTWRHTTWHDVTPRDMTSHHVHVDTYHVFCDNEPYLSVSSDEIRKVEFRTGEMQFSASRQFCRRDCIYSECRLELPLKSRSFLPVGNFVDETVFIANAGWSCLWKAVQICRVLYNNMLVCTSRDNSLRDKLLARVRVWRYSIFRTELNQILIKANMRMLCPVSFLTESLGRFEKFGSILLFYIVDSFLIAPFRHNYNRQKFFSNWLAENEETEQKIKELT